MPTENQIRQALVGLSKAQQMQLLDELEKQQSGGLGITGAHTAPGAHLAAPGPVERFVQPFADALRGAGHTIAHPVDTAVGFVTGAGQEVMDALGKGDERAAAIAALRLPSHVAARITGVEGIGQALDEGNYAGAAGQAVLAAAPAVVPSFLRPAAKVVDTGLEGAVSSSGIPTAAARTMAAKRALQMQAGAITGTSELSIPAAVRSAASTGSIDAELAAHNARQTEAALAAGPRNMGGASAVETAVPTEPPSASGSIVSVANPRSSVQPGYVRLKTNVGLLDIPAEMAKTAEEQSTGTAATGRGTPTNPEVISPIRAGEETLPQLEAKLRQIEIESEHIGDLDRYPLSVRRTPEYITESKRIHDEYTRIENLREARILAERGQSARAVNPTSTLAERQAHLLAGHEDIWAPGKAAADEAATKGQNLIDEMGHGERGAVRGDALYWATKRLLTGGLAGGMMTHLGAHPAAAYTVATLASHKILQFVESGGLSRMSAGSRAALQAAVDSGNVERAARLISAASLESSIIERERRRNAERALLQQQGVHGVVSP